MRKRVLIPYRHPKKLKAYEVAARAAGMEPEAVLTKGPISLDAFAGLLLMGGTDVNPRRYDEVPQPETDRPDDERDEIELQLIQMRLKRIGRFWRFAGVSRF